MKQKRETAKKRRKKMTFGTKIILKVVEVE